MKILRIPLVIVLLSVAGRAFNAGAQTETVLYSFTGDTEDGANPQAPLVQGNDGNFYGTTFTGGTSTNCGVGVGCGSVFRISPSGSYSNLYFFGSSPNDGENPLGLVQGNDGNFYGTSVVRWGARRWHRVSDQSGRQLHESLFVRRRHSGSRARAGQRRQFLRDDFARRNS